jgi:transcriptional regulator with XRE-family HTH domain
VVRLEGDWPAVQAAVRERRTALGMSTAELARRAGLSPTTIRYIGGRPNRHYVLYEIERVLGWPRGHLIGILTGESPTPPATSVATGLTRIEKKVDELTTLVRNGSAPEP